MPLVTPTPRAQRPPAPAKLRIRDTADRLFYENGIRTVGIDRLISDSAVTKATFYKHYRSKDILIVDYVTSRHTAAITALDELVAAAPDARSAILEFATLVAAEVSRPGFRGCPFLNAAAEFANPAHPLRVIIAEHREAFTDRLVDLARAVNHPVPGDAADDLMLARDGAMAGGYASDPVAASAALGRAVERVLADVKQATPFRR